MYWANILDFSRKYVIFVFGLNTLVRWRWTELAGKEGKLVIVSSDVLPDIISKVLSAKQLKARVRFLLLPRLAELLEFHEAHIINIRIPFSIMKNNLQTTLFLFIVFLRDEKGCSFINNFKAL